MAAQKWNRIVLALTIGILVVIALIQIIIDPFLHYHDCLKGLQYPLRDERFINDGLQRHREYEILVIGTSMSQNFNPSLFDSLWGMKTIKTAYSGASFHELGENMGNAVSHNPDLKYIVCSLDPNMIMEQADADAYEGIPYYLYDSNPFNDVNYLFNKDVLIKSIAVLNYTRSGQKTPDMDLYGRFDIYMPTGEAAVLNSYVRLPKQDLSMPFSQDDKDVVYANVVNNFVSLARKNPDVKFVFYVPPYSYCYWDAMVRTKQMDYSIEVIKYAVSLLLDEKNVEVYSFLQWDDVTTNLDYYSDNLHYNGEICDRITESIFNGEGRLNTDNLDEYFAQIEDLYNLMDYSALDRY